MTRRIALNRVLRGLAVFAFFTHSAAQVDAGGVASPRAEITTHPRIEVAWVGGPTMVIEFGELTILTDPVLGPEGFEMGDPNVSDLHTVERHRRRAPFHGVQLDSVDLVILSHIHEDHFDQEAQATLRDTVPILAPNADVEALTAMGFSNVDGMEWGESRQFRVGTGRMTITAVIAHHSRNPQIATTLGAGNGYWIEFSNGDGQRTLYWTGDTMPTRDVVEAVRSLGAPDVMVAHVGGVGTAGPLGRISMGAEDVRMFTADIRPGRILPIHHSTYAFYREPISELVSRNEDEGNRYALDVIAEGATVVYGGSSAYPR